jgi:hypothetical protein
MKIAGGTVAKTCTSQPTEAKNFACLVFWLCDLVRNMERGIETFREAFFNDGAKELALRDDTYDGLQVNLYQGPATRKDSFNDLERALHRLSLGKQDALLTWATAPGENWAKLRVRLKSGRLVEKSSTRQRSTDHNIHALALWLRTKAKNYERGLEPDLEALFAANLLPA